MDFPARLRELRIAANLSQLDLALAMGWSGQSQVSNYENNRGDPSFSDLPKLAKTLGVSVAELFTDPGTKTLLPSHVERINPSTLEMSIKALRRVAKNFGMEYDPEINADVTAAAYELALALGAEPGQSQVIDFATAVAGLLSRGPGGDDDGGGRKVGGQVGGNHRERVARKART